jgi:hypothetical protein
MNAAVAYYLAEQTTPDAAPRPHRPRASRAVRARRGRSRRIPALLAVTVMLFSGSIVGIAFADSGEDQSPASPSATAGSSDSDGPDARPGRAGPGYAVDR